MSFELNVVKSQESSGILGQILNKNGGDRSEDAIMEYTEQRKLGGDQNEAVCEGGKSILWGGRNEAVSEGEKSILRDFKKWARPEC